MPKIILLTAVVLFIGIGAVGIVKKLSRSDGKSSSPPQVAKVEPPVKAQEIPIKAPPPPPPSPPSPPPPPPPAVVLKKSEEKDLPQIDRIFQLFTTGPMKLPIVETISYTSSVPWIKGRPAWIADYAAHYQTSRHFIARSLNGKEDYFTQKVSTGSKFNVFRKDKNIHFYLVIDVSHCKMGFYYFDLDTQERVLLKTYQVGLGRLDSNRPSGTLTPLGKYSLGSKVAIYKPGVMGYFQDRTVELIRVFGTRWLPFDQEMEGATSPAKGYGLHGAPWTTDPQSGQLVENRGAIDNKYDSDGCVRLFQKDIEEIFSIVVSKPTFVLIIKQLSDAQIPGIEVAAPK